MSRRKGLSAVWRDAIGDSDLDSTAKLVAYALSTWMNGQGRCRPGRRAIARRTSLSVRAVDPAIRRLELSACVAVERTAGGNPETTANRYLALLPPGANEVRRSEWRAANLTTARGESDALSGERGSPESFRKRLKAGDSAAAPLLGSAPSSPDGWPEGECEDCHEQGVALVDEDSLYCAECLAAREHDGDRRRRREMGDLVRFPGAVVDYDHLDRFEWTPELLAEYAARARELAARYGSNAPTAELPSEPEGVCDDCGKVVPRRWRFGTRASSSASATSPPEPESPARQPSRPARRPCAASACRSPRSSPPGRRSRRWKARGNK